MLGPMLQRALAAARANIKKIFASKHAFGQQIGETVAGLVITGPVAAILVKNYRGGDVKVNLSEIDRISIDRSGDINHDNNGTLVAILYKGDDGNHYKHTAVGWYTWNGSDWVV